MKQNKLDDKPLFMYRVEEEMVTGKVIELQKQDETKSSRKTLPLSLYHDYPDMPVEPQGYMKVKKHDYL